MMKLICLAVFVTIVSADVSHLFNNDPYQQQRYQPYRPTTPQYYKPTPAPINYVRPEANYVKTGEAAAAILRLDSDILPDGSYEYTYETENGIGAQQRGTLKQIDKDVSVVVQGSYQYQSPEGPVQVSYVADENGYQPSGNVLPTPPPTPEAILRSIQYNEAHEKDVQHVQHVQPIYRPY